MKKIYIAIAFLSVTFLAIAGVLNEDGKAGRTGSPNEFDCTGCHTSFPVNSGGGSIIISSPNLTNWMYVPGQTYQIDVTVAKTGTPLFGFGFEALRTSNNSNAGTLAITNSVETKLQTVSISGTPRTNVVHKQDGGLTPDSHTFSFNWVAPATNIGNVRFWTAGNAANNQSDSLGDYIYKTSQLVTPFVTGIDEADGIANCIVSPNPAKDFFELKGIKFEAGEGIEVIDVSGKIVYKLTLAANSTTVKVKTSGFKNGLYFINYRGGKQDWKSKVLVLH